jgi:hypothetical protein
MLPVFGGRVTISKPVSWIIVILKSQSVPPLSRPFWPGTLVDIDAWEKVRVVLF